MKSERQGAELNSSFLILHSTFYISVSADRPGPSVLAEIGEAVPLVHEPPEIALACHRDDRTRDRRRLDRAVLPESSSEERVVERRGDLGDPLAKAALATRAEEKAGADDV